MFLVSQYKYIYISPQKNIFHFRLFFVRCFSLFFMGIDYFGPTAPPLPLSPPLLPPPSPFTRHDIFFALERKKRFFPSNISEIISRLFYGALKNNVHYSSGTIFYYEIAYNFLLLQNYSFYIFSFFR